MRRPWRGMKTDHIEVRRWLPSYDEDWRRRGPLCRRRGCIQQGGWNARYYDHNGHLLQSYWWCDEDVPDHIRALPRHGGNYPKEGQA